ncbi:hypothetical protein DAPPUDRAFT_320320 [Daphnia pulex]|uniref:hAT-like transposase RNase-H fold domain-containing protein n=1 Tax=Daphnia pulex TaxID=6669 RepID=E9GPI9_DAPPU|nr:hypothetical protein DAPPUDRAFT_320320 [Daphnia pulex]|eukprot:EFX78645.1 hypothetical protein DAPPUDRAFT_320320 [Daphnia pulex]
MKEFKKTSDRIPLLSATASAIIEKQEEYYQQAEKKQVYVIASILDPRIKLQFFKREAEKYNQHQEADTGDLGIKTCSEDWLDSIFQCKKTSNLEAEIKSYLQLSIEDKNVHPLEYWLSKKRNLSNPQFNDPKISRRPFH